MTHSDTTQRGLAQSSTKALGKRALRAALRVLPVALGLGCAAGGQSDAAKAKAEPGALGGDSSQLSPEVQLYAQGLQNQLKSARAVGVDELESQHALPTHETLGYDPLQAQHLDLIQKSALQLGTAELDVLARNGFVISSRQQFPSFTYGYATIYSQDLPVYISADSILDAVHRSYDTILASVEYSLLHGELLGLLTDLRAKLARQPESRMRSDLDIYLAVPEALLGADSVIPAAARALVTQAEMATGTATIKLFGVDRMEDFSQFKPRGHYTRSLPLQQYFRAMIWLGRLDFRLVETVGSPPEQLLRRPQVEAMLLLASLFDETALQRFTRIDETVRMFVGESDNMTLPQVPALLTALGVHDLSELAGISDATLKQALLSQGFGKQQIMSHLMAGGLDAPVPLNTSFMLFGQRYTVDSHVLSNVVWDRTRQQRMMPNPLDVSFAALGNDQALGLLKPELTRYEYAGDLAAMRLLVEQHDDAFWHANLYNDWLSSLRALSPQAAWLTDPAGAGMPAVTTTAAWGRRILDTQLASWAQLRHDTLLYAKQSYSGTAACEFPDAAVDPYPEFYAGIARFAEHGSVLAEALKGASDVTGSDFAGQIGAYFRRLGSVATSLQGIALAQASHTALSAEQLAFINDAVVIKKVSVVCASIDQASGWYARLFFTPSDPLAFDPTIADVHTQPTDEVGNPIGRVLHVGTGRPRVMVVTQDGCGEPRAYVGLSSSYYEQVTENWLRMTDPEWADKVRSTIPPVEPAWMQELLPGTR